MVFKSKFGIQQTISTLMKELLALRMDKREKFQDSNQIFVAHLSNLNATSRPTEETLVEYYTSALCPSIAMFVKR